MIEGFQNTISKHCGFIEITEAQKNACSQPVFPINFFSFFFFKAKMLCVMLEGRLPPISG